MPIGRLDHYSIRTTRVEETRRFYVEVMGLRDGPRPPFKFPGAWLYSGEQAVVHVVGIDPDDRRGLLDYLGDKAVETAGTGTLDHVAFTASDLDGLRGRLGRHSVSFRERTVPDLNLHQVFLEDPNGVTIELNFPAAELRAAAE